MSLASLIASQDLSLGEIARRAERRGFSSLTKSTLSRMLHQPIHDFPKTRTIYALAAGLDVDPLTVVKHCAISLGMVPNWVESPEGDCGIVLTRNEKDAADPEFLRENLRIAARQTRKRREELGLDSSRFGDNDSAPDEPQGDD